MNFSGTRATVERDFDLGRGQQVLGLEERETVGDLLGGQTAVAILVDPCKGTLEGRAPLQFAGVERAVLVGVVFGQRLGRRGTGREAGRHLRPVGRRAAGAAPQAEQEPGREKR
jgi:hypothetical protein